MHIVTDTLVYIYTHIRMCAYTSVCIYPCVYTLRIAGCHCLPLPSRRPCSFRAQARRQDQARLSGPREAVAALLSARLAEGRQRDVVLGEGLEGLEDAGSAWAPAQVSQL